MKPILVCTPRSGSTLLTRMLHNLAMQRFGYKGYLGEFFTVNRLHITEFARINGIVQRTKYVRTETRDPWCPSEREERLLRLRILGNDHQYMIKLFPVDAEPEIEDMIRGAGYDILYLERKNKLNQLLSFYGVRQTGTAFYDKGSTNLITKLRYDSKQTNSYFTIMDNYFLYKARNPSKYPTLFYEEFIDSGANEEYLIEKLGLDNREYEPCQVDSIPTPYAASPESLIENVDEWLLHKPNILERIAKFDTNTEV